MVHEGAGECVEDLGVGGRVIGVVEVQRFDEAASDEQPPETVREISREEGVFVGCDALGEPLECAEFRNAGVFGLFVRRDNPALGFGQVGNGDFFCEGHARAGGAFVPIQDGSELQFSGDEAFAEPFGFESLAWLIEFEVLEDHEEAVEIDLFVIIDGQVFVALGALKVYAEEEASYVAGEAGVIGFLLAGLLESFGEEERRAFFCFVSEIWTKDVAHECIEWAVFGDGLGEEPHPVVVFTSAFHPLDVERLGDASGEAWISEEAVDEGDAFYG